MEIGKGRLKTGWRGNRKTGKRTESKKGSEEKEEVLEIGKSEVGEKER